MTEIERLRTTLADELTQRDEEGCDVADLRGEVEAQGLAALSAAEVTAYLDRLAALPVRPGFAYREPSGLASIQAARPAAPPLPAADMAEYEQRLRGAWLGRCAGCCLGKPVELWPRQEIRRYLDAAGVGELRDYLPLLDPNPAARPLHPSALVSTRGNIDGMPRDDDIDYCILALLVLEAHGLEASTEDWAAAWLERLPFMQVYTAERAAYRNLVLGVPPGEAARVQNPYREWIGAQIRADVLGYVSPGLPAQAAELAYRDAALSHVKNGIYGEMWAAASVAAAFSLDDPVEAVGAGLAQIPAASRLHEALTQTLAWSRELPAWEQAWERVEAAYGGYHTVHTINNACYTVLGLAYGRGDFGATVGIAVACGEDTDCNGATAGSIFGAAHGAAAVPDAWTAPFHDRAATRVSGAGEPRISGLIERTARLERKFRGG